MVDSADARRLWDCARELHSLLREERLAGATLLVLANKSDLPGALTLQEIREVMAKLVYYLLFAFSFDG